jgi:hypothetical protein
VKVRPIHFVPDVEAALRFYEALGLDVEARSRTGHWVELGTAGGDVARRLRDVGFPPEGEIVDREWGRSLFVRGPDGDTLQIDEQDRELYT